MRNVYGENGVPELDIRLFGRAEIRVSGRDVTREVSRRAILLLALLAISPGKAFERRWLAGVLWPDSSEAGTMHNLRQTLARLRRVLGTASNHIVNISPRSLALRPGAEVLIDVTEFDVACADGQPDALSKAVELHGEPLLCRWDEPLVELARSEREERFIVAAVRLAEHLRSVGDHGGAAGLLRRVLVLDPYRESACRALMNALADCGESTAALDAYRELRRVLHSDLRTEPEAQTKALYRNIRQSRGRQAGAPCSEPTYRIPVPLTPLIGRERDIQDVTSVFERCRLVTLVGMGGVGKTRLSLAVASALADRYPEGTCFVDFSPIEDGTMVESAIAGALGIVERGDRPLIQSISEGVRRSQFLLVLDNCEQVSESVAKSVDAMLVGAPGLYVLATSRQPLGVMGEFVWRVPALLTSDSVRLFVDRARRSGCSEVQGPSGLAAVESLCQKLEGIPLAIELAAARTNVLSAEEIEVRLDKRFALLAGAGRATERHRSLEAAFQWSWVMLSELERDLLMRLSVFRGGCSLEAIEAVASHIGQEPLVLDQVASLVDKSFLQEASPESAQARRFGSRFSMLETIRQFAEERLQESGNLEIAVDVHRDHFLNLVEDPQTNHGCLQEALYFERFELEHDNFRAALGWCHARGQAHDALRLAVHLCRFWDTHGHLTEGRARIEGALQMPQEGSPVHLLARAYGQAGWMATVQRDCAVAQEHYEKLLAFCRELGDLAGTARALNCLGMAFFNGGDYASARIAYEESLEFARAQAKAELASAVLSNLAEVALALRDNAAARIYLEKSIAEVGGPMVGDPQQRGQTLCDLALTDFRQGLFDEARQHALDALRLFERGQLLVDVPGALNQIGVVDAARGEAIRAVKLLGAAEQLSAAVGVPPSVLVAQERADALTAARKALGEDAYEASLRLGGSMSMNEAIALGLSD